VTRHANTTFLHPRAKKAVGSTAVLYRTIDLVSDLSTYITSVTICVAQGGRKASETSDFSAPVLNAGCNAPEDTGLRPGICIWGIFA